MHHSCVWLTGPELGDKTGFCPDSPDLVFLRRDEAVILDPTVICERMSEWFVSIDKAKVENYLPLSRLCGLTGKAEVSVFCFPVGRRYFGCHGVFNGK